MKRVLKIMFGNILITGAYAFITVPNKIVNGGVTSFSMVLEEFSSIPITYFVDFITILLLICCYIFLGKTYFTGTILSCICYLVFFSIFHDTGLYLVMNPILCTVIAGVLVGIGYYFCISAKSTAVGFDVIALILNKKNPKVNIALCMYTINVCVLLFGLFAYRMISILMGIGFTSPSL
ncbi:YitT family protein [Sellimonas caecigallum]|uniref:YitT family protein n=2 Tax=Sellimonas caecigallum TaxID=2592333 RepID=A0ABS7LAD8_9FIRM|nr:YitT family protein [Sellimonas caecigallum]